MSWIFLEGWWKTLFDEVTACIEPWLFSTPVRSATLTLSTSLFLPLVCSDLEVLLHSSFLPQAGTAFSFSLS